jgi:hypothetical protein
MCRMTQRATGLVDVARYVVSSIFDEIQRISNTRFLSNMASDNEASIACQAHCPSRHPTHFESAIMEVLATYDVACRLFLSRHQPPSQACQILPAAVQHAIPFRNEGANACR